MKTNSFLQDIDSEFQDAEALAKQRQKKKEAAKEPKPDQQKPVKKEFTSFNATAKGLDSSDWSCGPESKI